MTHRYNRGLHIFRRDLRLHDNTALNAALKECRQVFCCFFFDPRQCRPHPYFSAPAFTFLLESLKELNVEIELRGSHLYLLDGEPEKLISQVISELKVDAVYFNRDYTPFARKRDDALLKICASRGVTLEQHGDSLLHEPEAALKSDRSPYTVFTPFYKRCAQLTVREPAALESGRFGDMPLTLDQQDLLTQFEVPQLPGERAFTPGRKAALSKLSMLGRLERYQSERDFPALEGTSRLSAHNKFGTCSIREVFKAVSCHLGSSHALIRELYWRDFFTHIAFHFPKVFGNPFRDKFRSLEWSNNENFFNRWSRGETGYPIVDAGMRQLNTTGFMHNRVRMITASFLTKHLQIDWRLGEQYFATRLIDYDPSVNNGNWQWAASTGCDAQPYFRVFNPWLQQQKFDSQADYVKRWVPQLREIEAKKLHDPKFMTQAAIPNYLAPIVDHDIARLQAIEMFEAG